MDSKKIMAIFIAVALVIVIVSVVIALNQNHDETNGEYNFTYEYADSFKGTSGLSIYPQDGRKFVITEITLKNDSFSKGISTSAAKLAWKLTLDKVTYDVNLAYTELHPDYWSVVVEQGRTWVYTVVFEVSEHSVGKKDISLSYTVLVGDSPSLRYNKDLRITDTGSPVDDCLQTAIPGLRFDLIVQCSRL